MWTTTLLCFAFGTIFDYGFSNFRVAVNVYIAHSLAYSKEGDSNRISFGMSFRNRIVRDRAKLLREEG